MSNDIRVGKVSSVDYNTGMLRVTYTDKGQAVTANMPYANYNNEYNMPSVGESVVVSHLSNGSSRGVVIGTMWNKNNTPAECGKGLYRKDLSKTKGAALYRYDDSSGEYLLKAPNIKINSINEIVMDGPKITIDASISITIDSPEMGLKALKGIELQAAATVKIKADSDIELEDNGWKTNLSKIMERIGALDGDMSDKK